MTAIAAHPAASSVGLFATARAASASASASPSASAPASAPCLTAPALQSGTVAPAAAPAAGAVPAHNLALALHAALLSQPTAAHASQALVLTLARQLGFDRVWLAWADGLHLQLLARSDGAGLSPASAADVQQQSMLAAAAECFDQAAVVAWPCPATDEPGDATQPNGLQPLPRITLAHAALFQGLSQALPPARGAARAPATRRRAEPLLDTAFQDTVPSSWPDAPAQPPAGGCAVSVPLVVDGVRVGALCLHRLQGGGLGLKALQQLEHLACLTAPLLWLMKRNERSTWQRLRDGTRHRWSLATTQRKRQWRALAALAATAALVPLLLPWPAQVGGRARLEGAVQRVLAAPADGFVQQVHARAGDSVRAGQPLLDLADQDLQLERQRWQSQLAQHLDALATAQARADRTQLVLQQSRADEAQSQLSLIEERLQRARLVAPFDAVVVQGDWSQQLGAPVKEGTELLTLAPLDRFRVMVEVDERDIGAVHALGRDAAPGTLALTALPWDTLALRVTRVSPLAKAVEGRNVFEVEAELLDTPAALRTSLRPGLQGTARLDAGAHSPLVHLLRRALGAARVAWWEWLG